MVPDAPASREQNQESADYKKRNAERMRKDYKRTRGGEDATKEELEAKFPYPSRLQGLLTANQLASHCDAISKFTGQSFSKLYLVKGLQENAQ
jgi:translation initiation factor 3 subunit H